MSERTIQITELDRKRLIDLIVEAQSGEYRKSVYLDKLRGELERAEIVAPQNIPADVITMNSTVTLIDQETGDPIPERAGKVRWFMRLPSDELAWADTKRELLDTYGETPEHQPKSLAFFPGTMDDNPIGRKADPGYEANLMLQPAYMRQRMRYGNWKARPTAGKLFQAHFFDVIDAVPAGRQVRFWDLAATRPSPATPDPDYTVGCLEIAEEVLLLHPDVATERIRGLKRRGIRLAIDDFGGGYSALRQIRKFPIDVVKIHKSFVDSVTASPADSELTHSLIELARRLKFRTLAEGIEVDQQAQALERMGCELGQGYYLSRPVDAAGFEGMLDSFSGGDWRDAAAGDRPRVAAVRRLAS